MTTAVTLPRTLYASKASRSAAIAGTDDREYLTALTARAGLKQAAFTPDVDTRAFYAGSSSGFFADYNCKGGVGWLQDQAEDQSAQAGGGFRDTLFSRHVDRDTVNYTAIGQKVSMAMRGIVTGAYDASTNQWQTQYKDLVGADFHAIGRVGWNNRGVSGVACGAIQYGTGIASNEFSVENPSAHDQSVSMAGVQAITRPYKAADDGGHVYYNFVATNTGHRVTAAFDAQTAPISGSYNGRFRYGLNLARAEVEESALRLMGTGAGATLIEYDANDYTHFNRAANRYEWVVGGSSIFIASASGLNISGQASPLISFDSNDYLAFDKGGNSLNMVIGGAFVGGLKASGLYAGSGALSDTGAFLALSGGTTASASLRIKSGVAPTSPTNGDVWFDGTDLKIRIGGTTRTVSVT